MNWLSNGNPYTSNILRLTKKNRHKSFKDANSKRKHDRSQTQKN